MKWLPFGILACITIICQTTFVPSMAIHHIWPDWMFVLDVHYALWGPWPEAAIAAWFKNACVLVVGKSPLASSGFIIVLASLICVILRHYITFDAGRNISPAASVLTRFLRRKTY